MSLAVNLVNVMFRNRVVECSVKVVEQRNDLEWSALDESVVKPTISEKYIVAEAYI
jgi:hypothetical protein